MNRYLVDLNVAMLASYLVVPHVTVVLTRVLFVRPGQATLVAFETFAAFAAVRLPLT